MDLYMREVALDATFPFFNCDIVTSETRVNDDGGNNYEKEFNRNRIYIRSKRIHEWTGSRYDRRIQFPDQKAEGRSNY